MEASSNDRERAEALAKRVTVGIVTALPEERATMLAMLDRAVSWSVPGRGAGLVYDLGELPAHGGGHHVVALALADMGNNIAAARGTLLLTHFPEVEAIIMVGIAGGVPNPAKAGDHVRLGDVVVSDRRGIIQYDFVKKTRTATEVRASPRPPHARLLEAVRLLDSDALAGPRPWEGYAERAGHLQLAVRPDTARDVLLEAREPFTAVEHPADPKRTEGQPRIFMGPIASANVLLKDPVWRDQLRDQRGVKAVEMEASGIADATWGHGVGYLVVRGICDYCDSNKNDDWHMYAAVVAAAYTRALLGRMVGRDQEHIAQPKSATQGLDLGQIQIIPVQASSTVGGKEDSQKPRRQIKKRVHTTDRAASTVEGETDLNLADPLLFGNDAGEDEDPKVLASYFVDQSGFSTFSSPDRLLQLARARKGMGKSALLAKLAYDLRHGIPDGIVLLVTGSDLTGMGEFSSDDQAVLINQWQQVICSRINMEIGRQLGWTLTEDMVMVKSAELSGLNGRNVVSALVDRLKGRLGPVEMQKMSAANHTQLQRFSNEGGAPLVWLLVDDIDSTYVDSPKMKNKVSSFFSACRRIVQSVSGMRVRASVRADVWPALRDNEDLDKCEQYMTDIRWTSDELGTILRKRILAYIQRTQSKSVAARWHLEDQQDKIVELVFPRRISWGDTKVPPLQVINILAAKRPRWMAQLCRLAGAEASRRRRSYITMESISAVMPDFGKLRVSDLYKEHFHQYADIKRLIEAFARGPRRYSTEELIRRIADSYMSRVGAANVPAVEGYDNPSAMQIGHFLFKIGFIQGRSGTRDVPSFVAYDERPTLLTTSINADDGMVWEVGPSYRQVLGIF